MATPTSPRRHASRLAVIMAASLAAARRAWQTIQPSGNWQDQYDSAAGKQLVTLAAAAQLASTRESDTYVAAVLNELAFGPPTTPGVLNPTGFIGVTGDGRSIATLLAQGVTRAGEAYDDLQQAAALLPAGAPTQRERADMALASAQDYVDLIFHEIVTETARAAESAATVDRDWVAGYVRMLNPSGGKGSVPCSRCAILAGRFYKWSDGFERHPLCRCIHIPVSEADYKDLRSSPGAFFESLSEAEQDKVFTKAGAQAIRNGADIGQVVNARRGMQVAGTRGTITREITTEGTTRRGWYGGGYAARKYGYGEWFERSGHSARNVGQRGYVANYTERRALAARLMPAQIYKIAGDDREKAVELLKQNGFLV